MKMCLITATEKIDFVQDEHVNLTGSIGDGVAIMGFQEAEVSTVGLQYDSEQAIYDFFGVSSICNKMISAKARVTVIGEALLIVDRSVSMEKENDK